MQVQHPGVQLLWDYYKALYIEVFNSNCCLVQSPQKNVPHISVHIRGAFLCTTNYFPHQLKLN